MKTTRRTLAALAGGCAVVGACYSLDLTAIQPNTSFTREQVLQKPELIELVVAGVFINFWGGATYPQPWIQLSFYGEEVTTAANSNTNFNRGATQPIMLWDFSQETRVGGVNVRPAFDNSLTGTSLFARDPWSNFYEANAAATDMPRLIKENNLKIIDPNNGQDNTQRVLTFAKWIQGLSHAHLAMLFDSAAIIDESIDLSKVPELKFHGYKEVRDSGVAWLEKSIALAKEKSFIFPLKVDLWVYSTPTSNDELASIAHSYIARTLAYSARTPSDPVDWTKVKSEIAQGVTGPFGPLGIPNPLIAMDYRAFMSSAPQNTTAICNGFCGAHPGYSRVDLRLLGPADTTVIATGPDAGKTAYQAWLNNVQTDTFAKVIPFTIATPDQRVQASTVTVPAVKPTYYKYTNLPPLTTVQPPERGTYYWTNYWSSSRALNNHQQFPATGGGRARRTGDLNIIQDAMMLPVEMDLLMAEALMCGVPAGAPAPAGCTKDDAAAAGFINKSRQANGGLPAVTVAGVPASTPTAGCVPRRYDGTCGTLFDALIYEKRMETYGTAISYFDLRRWGCLMAGTPLHLPPPGRQLDLLGKPNYSYGGKVSTDGKDGSAPKPDAAGKCGILFKP